MVAALLLPLAFSPELYHSFWAPKAGLALVVLGPGLVALARLARAGSRPALLAACFVAVATAATAASEHPVASLIGGANWGTGLLFSAAAVGAWALGASAGEQRRRQVATALLAAALVNAVVAWLQARGLVPPSLDSTGRSSGLMGNPVHLGALAAGALWLVGGRMAASSARRAAPWVAAAALLGGAAQLSGGRSAVGLTVLVLVALVRRIGWRHGGVLAVAAFVGLLAGSAWAADGAVTGSARAVTQTTRQLDARGSLWRTSAGAVLERPLLGVGPGRFHAATSSRAEPVVSEGGVNAYADAHNWVVEYAVTTGLLGLLVLLAWLGTAVRSSGGPLAGFAVVAGVFMLVEPQSVSLTPLALLALGASSRRAAPSTPAGTGWRAVSTAGLLAGAVAAAVLLAGELGLRQATLDTSPSRYADAAALLPPWAGVSRIGVRISAFHGLHDEDARRQALVLARQATRRDPADPAAWSELAKLELAWGTDAGTARAVDRALERHPWQADALLVRAVLAERTGDAATGADSCRRLATLDRTPPVCGGPATVAP